MFEVRVEVEFPAAHHLIGYQGDCARPHGHNWKMHVFARSHGLDSIGMSVDFRILKKSVKELVARWDHQDLNLLEDFKDINPSAEQIARLAYNHLTREIAVLNKGDHKVWIDRVAVLENDRCSATYLGESPRT